MPSFAHTVEVNAPQSQVFAILDDVGRTPEWLTRCTRIDKVDEGPNAVGTRLKYHYKDGSRTGQMDGEITVRDADQHLAMVYRDKMMDVTVDFVAKQGGALGTTSLTHTIEIRTKGVGMLFAPIVKMTLPKQTTGAMDKLKVLAESEA